MTATITLTKKDFYNTFKAVSPAMSKDATRYYLNGACLESDGVNLKLTATNGHILHSVKLNTLSHNLEAGVRHIISADFINKLVKSKPKSFADDVTLIIEGHAITYKDNCLSLNGLLVDGIFPQYERVIPDFTGRDDIHKVRLNTKLLADIGKAVATLQGDKIENVVLQLPSDARDPILINDDNGNQFVLMPMRF